MFAHNNAEKMIGKISNFRKAISDISNGGRFKKIPTFTVLKRSSLTNVSF